MAWIESHQSLRMHPKTLTAAASLGVDRHKFIGHLQCLWWWGLDVADYEDGQLPASTTPAVIAAGSEWPIPKARQFVDVLVTAGFLEICEGRYILHDWWDYAGKYNAKRAANKERMREARATHVHGTNGNSAVHVQGLPDQPPLPDQPTNQPTQSNQPISAHVLNLTPGEWQGVMKNFPGVNVQSRWKEWILWIEEDEKKRTPRNKVSAFEGWLKKG